MIRLLAVLISLVGAVFAAAEDTDATTHSGQNAAAVVTGVRVGENASVTRFVLDMNAAVNFATFLLDDPWRLVVDMPQVGWRLPPRPLPSNTGLLKNFRYGLFKPGTTRVVVDLKAPARVAKAFVLRPTGPHAYRLVIDVAEVDQKTFARLLEAPPRTVASAGPKAPAPGVKPPPPPAGLTPPAVPLPAAAMRVAPPVKPLRKPQRRTIALDPGHGGIDPGAIGARGTYEKHITLNMARELRALLESTGRYKVVQTRDRDIFVRLRDRVARAREAGADLFLSLHADSIRRKNLGGASVYTLSERASDEEAALLAEKENKADLIAGVDLSDEAPEVTNILIDLAQRETMNQSAKLASRLVRELKKETNVLRNSHRFAGFAVLKAPDVPSVLIELGFLTNRQDERNLGRKAYRRKLGKAIVAAIDSYFTEVEEAARQ